jgi:hypothetical protein
MKRLSNISIKSIVKCPNKCSLVPLTNSLKIKTQKITTNSSWKTIPKCQASIKPKNPIFWTAHKKSTAIMNKLIRLWKGLDLDWIVKEQISITRKIRQTATGIRSHLINNPFYKDIAVIMFSIFEGSMEISSTICNKLL